MQHFIFSYVHVHGQKNLQRRNYDINVVIFDSGIMGDFYFLSAFLRISHSPQ